jgi:hypothetical protein
MKFLERIADVCQRRWILFSALGFLLVIIYYELLFALGFQHPSPGTAVVWLAISAGVMSLQPDMYWTHKVIWVFILGCFGYIELKSINIDRAEHEAEVSGTLARMEVIARSTFHIEHLLVANVAVPTTNVIQSRHNFTSKPPSPPALMQFDNTAIHAELEPINGALTVFVPGKPLTVDFRFSNHGTGVAHKTLAAVAAGIFNGSSPDINWENQQFANLRQGWEKSTKDNFATLEDIAPGANRFKVLNSKFSLNNDMAAALTNGKGLFYVFGILGWKDGSGNHSTEICSYLQPPGNVATWNSCASGHNVIN